MHRQKHILVADEEAPLRFFANRLLRNAGYLVSEASDGRQAHLMVLAAHQCHAQFDLVLLNSQMSYICGGQLLEELTQLPFCPPLLLMCEMCCTPNTPLADDHCRGLISKPFIPKILLEAVAHALGKHTNHSTLELLATRL